MLPTLRDLRHALRTLRRSPGFTITAVLSLALGLGLTTTAFAVVDAVRHPHSLIPAPEQIVTLVVRRTGGTPVTGARRIIVRGDGGPAGARMASRLKLDLQAAVPGGTATEAQPWLLGFEQVQRARAFLSVLFASLGAVALTLAAIGQYGVLAYAVGQRRREFGVRLALGARPVDVFRLVMREGFVLLLAGTAAGAFLAMWTASILESWLYGVPPTDVWSLVVAEGVLALASLAACALPALRATRSNPVDVLRAA